MEQLQVLEYKGQRILTTQQLAESYGTDNKNINDNFQNNSKRYISGKHYFHLEGQELKDFKASTKISGNIKYSPALMIWTEKGAWLHAKSLNTDRAWEAYELLVDDYFNKATKIQPSFDVKMLTPEMQMFKYLFDGVAHTQLEQVEIKRQLADHTEKVNKVESTVTAIQDTMLTRDEDWRKSMNSMLNAAAFRMGGKYQDLRNESYIMLEKRGKCNLKNRLSRLQKRLLENGSTKTKISGTSRMDVIESDPKLKEIYTSIVKELSIGSLKIVGG